VVRGGARQTLINELAAAAGLTVRELHRTTMAEVPAALANALPSDITTGDTHAQWHLHLLELGVSTRVGSGEADQS
jgi:hypothetical protein